MLNQPTYFYRSGTRIEHLKKKKMESSSSSSTVIPVKNPTLTPKAIIHQKYGKKACYTIEEKQEPPENDCPGLVVPPKGGSCLFICRLQLPELTVVSPPCKRKKEAEQSASQMALQQLGIDSRNTSPTTSDAAEELVSRLSYIFSNEFLSSLHPLSSHLKAMLRREGELNASLPVSTLIACDAKLVNLCKSINPMIESNPFLSIPLVMRAAVRLSELIVISEGELWIRRHKPYPLDLIPTVVNEQSHMACGTCIKAVYISPSLGKDVQSISLNLHSNSYYLDFIAQELGVVDASKVLISRAIGKASSEMRLYFSALEAQNLHPVLEFCTARKLSSDGSFNVHASYLLGQHVYGNAILASIGYTWRAADLFSEDLSLRSYFRILVGKKPDGLYKLSREAILLADLPTVFTIIANWRGSSPKDLLCAFCRQHRLSEPVFSVVCQPCESSQGSSRSCKKVEAEGSNMRILTEKRGASAADGKNMVGKETFKCDLKVFSKNQDLILQSSPKIYFKKQGDAVQDASLRILSWLNLYFKQPNMPLEKLSFAGTDLDVKCNPTCFLKEFSMCQLIHNVQQSSDAHGGNKLTRNHVDPQNNIIDHEDKQFFIEGPERGSSPSNGCLVSVRYIVTLVSKGKELLDIVESNDEFEFEIGSGSVIPCIEAALLQMTAGQSVCLTMDLPPWELVLAAALGSQKVLSYLSSKACCLEYSITLLHAELLEDRMEQALFSPPLSKQRVEYALQWIKESASASLIDFGFGSGSLLDSLVGSPSSLEKIVGVDISQKGLIRAAKILSSKVKMLEEMMPASRIKSAILYEGSITVFDSRLYGFDLGTCLEDWTSGRRSNSRR